ncbi:universal stress protein [Pseudodesulfovibrio portus]|uniref:Universal stress protein UspA n=1 Tax=Pseudodesulfovibrio portus TaxID=231439 RepID=A0ABN6RXQ8_9BACT|nr:universal stress protein [Pseudodesulfovibrio portus]BDQ34372.1 universal stress protein UspA [Pseudodesulfovibrio portus]
MQKELLLAVGDERAASYTLRYLKEVYSDFCDLRLTLFYAAPRPPSREMCDDGLTPSDKGLHKLDAAKRSKGGKAIEDGLKWLKDIAGCQGDNVRTKIVHSRKGTANELIDEARAGKYDALLLGRRGFSWFEEMFANSVSHELLWQDIDFPIWICRRPPKHPRRHVLLCMDGSSAGLRMVDHAGYMLAKETSHTFTLFHVTGARFDTAESTRIFDEGLAALAENGIAEERIEMKIVKESNQVKAILKEAAEGNYLAVGVGRHGEYERSQKQHLFPDSTCVNLLRQMEDTALWISK